MSAFIGDYLGFKLGGIHSSQLNITRVSVNGRYSENLTPDFTDGTAVAPGRDETYYWSTSYTQKTFVIDFAFDNLMEQDLRRLKSILNFKGVQELIFDETPYKKYMVKCSSPPVLKYVPFGDDYFRIYKGEGTLNLIAYYPYAIGLHENIIESTYTYDFDNIGDLEIPFKLTFNIASSETLLVQLFKISYVGEDISKQNLLNMTPQGKIVLSYLPASKKYCINMKTHLIEELDSYNNKTKYIYNDKISEGDFFTVPVEGVYRLYVVNDYGTTRPL